MACPAPFDRFRLATENLPNTAFQRGVLSDPWIGLIEKGLYENGSGLALSTFLVGRSEPTDDEPAFTPITLSTGETYTGSCGTTYNQIDAGYKEVLGRPEGFGWKGIPVCEDDLIYNHKAAQFLSMYFPALQKNIIRTVSNRMQAIYTHYVPKAVANEDFAYTDPDYGYPGQGPDLTLPASLCQLDQTMLDATAIELNEEGAMEPDSNGWINFTNGPIYPLLIGQEASNNIVRVNSEFRSDVRYADMGKGDGSALLRRFGAPFTLKNFHHMITATPPRYSWNGVSYVRIPTYVMSTDADDATKGSVAKINPNWRSSVTAPFEGCWVLNPSVFRSLVINPVLSAAGVSWPEKNYMGNLTWKVGGSKIYDPPCYDPEEKLGMHFGSYKHVPMPKWPIFGRFIIFKRCATTFGCTDCS